jgi:hypothetical protein
LPCSHWSTPGPAATAAASIVLSAHSVATCRPEQHQDMRLRSEQIPLTERIASKAVATGITVATTLLMLAASRSRFMPLFSSALPRGSGRTLEQLTYIVPHSTALTPAPAHTRTIRSSRAEPEQRASSARPEQVAVPYQIHMDSASVAASTSTRTDHTRSDTEDPWVRRALFRFHASDSASPLDTIGTNPSYSSGASASMLATGGAMGFPRARSEPARVDSALRAVHDNLAAGLSTGVFETPLSKQAQLDEQLRAKALAAIAAKAAGVPTPRGMLSGGGISAPLPFGGPSRARRQRDSAINATTAKRLARVRQRLDSVAAARRRRSLDSLAQIADSLRRNTGQRP